MTATADRLRSADRPSLADRLRSGRDGAGTTVLRLGTRRSALALTQSATVARDLEAAAEAADRPVRVELVELATTGDLSAAPLTEFGGVGVFVSRLREALISGEVDLAVHSLKDLPTGACPGIRLAAVPLREDPRDVLIAGSATLASLPAGARIGTGSPRRAAQLRALGRGLDVVGLRGNVDTRIRRVGAGPDGLDGVVLAYAGLLRLGRSEEVSEVLAPEVMLPAPGQGALAVECRDDDLDLSGLLAALDDPVTRAAVIAERSLLARLEAGCSAPLGALADVADDRLTLRAVVLSVDGGRRLDLTLTRELPAEPGDRPEAARRLGVELAEELLAKGAAELMPAVTDHPDRPGRPGERGEPTTMGEPR